MNDVMGGQVPVVVANVASGMGHVKGGKLRAMALTGSKRIAALPDLPTMAEAGVPGYEVYEWNGIFAPAGTPAPIWPLAPALFSTTTGWPSASDIFGAMRRAMRSAPPPGG